MKNSLGEKVWMRGIIYADRIHFGNPDREVPDHPFRGPAVDGSELAQVAREDGQPMDEIEPVLGGAQVCNDERDPGGNDGSFGHCAWE